MKLTTIFAISAMAMALLVAPSALKPAQALSGLQAADIKASDVVEVRKRHFGGRKHFRAHKHLRSARHFRAHRHFRGRKHFHVHRFYGARISIGHSCRWLRHRAIVTGSRYWWRRYYQCRYGRY